MEHLVLNGKLLLGVIGFVAWLIMKVGAKRADTAAKRAGRPVATGPHGTMRSANVDLQARAQADAEARVRRAREEAARQLTERRILMMPARPPAQPESESSFFEDEESPPALAPRPAAPPAAPLQSAASYQPGVMALPPSPITLPALVEAMPSDRPGAAWLDELRAPQTARRAILLTEILGPPVALR